MYVLMSDVQKNIAALFSYNKNIKITAKKMEDCIVK